MNLVTANDTNELMAPPVAILGLTFPFVQWLSTTVLVNEYAILPIHVICYLSNN